MTFNNYNDSALAEVTDIDNIEPEAIAKLSRDLRDAAATMSSTEARYLVDTYYQLQNNRIREKNRLRALTASGEPHKCITYFSDNFFYLEKQLPKMLQVYAANTLTGSWSLGICGIGPIIAAGLLAHIDIEKAPHVSHILSFAGMDGSGKAWNRGEKRPWNAALKTLLWKASESFVKVSGREQDYYGKVYRNWKDIEAQRNEQGYYAELAASILANKKFGKDTEAFKAYSAGRLPLAHMHARAKRKAVSLFISHWHEIRYFEAYGRRPERPSYAVDKLGHKTYIPPPMFDFK